MAKANSKCPIVKNNIFAVHLQYMNFIKKRDKHSYYGEDILVDLRFNLVIVFIVVCAC